MLAQVTPAHHQRPPLADQDVQHVLLVRLRVGLGDLLCTVPALRALRVARPDLSVAVTTWPETAVVLDRFRGYADELVPFPGAPGIPERPPDGTLSRWAASVRRRRFDLALQMYGDNQSATEVTALVGARTAGGFATADSPELDPALHLPYPHARHEVERHLLLFEHLGLPRGASRALEWPVTPADEAAAEDLRPNRPYVVLHPGATSQSRRWPADRFAAVGDALTQDGLAVLVGGVGGEQEVTGRVLAAMRAPAVDLTGRTDLGTYAVLLRDAAVVVANDTGAAHLTAAVGGRVVTVFLSGDPVRWRHDETRQAVVREDVGCNPCRHLVCPIDFRCAHAVSAARVVAAARGMLATTAWPSAAP
jgi:ADP-heptose:LPS heptosyltransferase